MKNEITGYKCFNKGLVNRYGKKFELNKLYHCEGEIIYGNHGNGFHMCKYLEDTMKFFDVSDDKTDITEVKCYGNYCEVPNTYKNEYVGNYNMYAYEYMIITKILSREEIISYMLNCYPERVKKFLIYFMLTPAEKELFYLKFSNNQTVIDYIEYYQNNNKEIFTRKREY